MTELIAGIGIGILIMGIFAHYLIGKFERKGECNETYQS